MLTLIAPSQATVIKVMKSELDDMAVMHEEWAEGMDVMRCPAMVSQMQRRPS